ncbi:MAG: type 1 glutamine amidotransferase [Calditrichaeota bacterium]|nr:MAG: type 1 glutamine amidotransferase [Calditrichota bacterium]
MNKHIAIIQHVPHEGPGRFLHLLREAGCRLSFYDLSKLLETPEPDSFDGCIVMGGPDSANDDTPKMRRMRAFTETVLEAGKPYLGICLGMQLLGRAAGGQVIRAPQKETGCLDEQGAPWRVHLNADGREDPVTSRLDASFPIFHLHGETVLPNENIRVLGEGTSCRVQIIRVGARAYGFQGHPEMTRTLFDLWKEKEPWMKHVQSRDFLRLEAAYISVVRNLIHGWLDLPGNN